ncbi:hypothetical protein MUK42_33302 [Musa troglodytarum]|uniref:Uncharacterized protein n=1 Tax=Musa troglodytarum TaxID=320322 RepID=A0A9E7JZV9_9LILI|nr:hypothetical protein MUK42_33302 [Musa troglodytarum]
MKKTEKQTSRFCRTNNSADANRIGRVWLEGFSPTTTVRRSDRVGIRIRRMIPGGETTQWQPSGQNQDRIRIRKGIGGSGRHSDHKNDPNCVRLLLVPPTRLGGGGIASSIDAAHIFLAGG